MNYVLAPEGPAIFLQIAGAIRLEIEQGRLVSGEQLPSSRALAERFGVNRHTVMASMHELRAQGWIEVRPRSAYTVARDLPDKYFVASSGAPNKRSQAVRLPFARQEYAQGASTQPARVSFDLSTGRPDVRLFPLAEFRSCISDALRKPDETIMGYGDPAGTPRLRDALGDYLRKFRGITGSDIFVTNSSVEGIYLLAHLMLKPGDKVAIEAIGFRPAIDAIRSTGASVIPIATGPSGLEPDALEKKLRRTEIRALYLTPLHQYPTTVTLGIENRKRIYALARKHRFAIFEDDYDHEYHYASQPLAPMAAHDPFGLVMYVSSFSKILFPGIRVGFLAVPEYVSEGLRYLRRRINRQNNALVQDAVGRWMEQGGLGRHLRKTRRIYAQRRDVLCEALDGMRADGLQLGYSKPNGGMTVWLDTGSDSASVSHRAMERGLRLTPDAVSFTKPKIERNHVRLGFAAHTPEELRSGSLLLRELLAGSQPV